MKKMYHTYSLALEGYKRDSGPPAPQSLDTLEKNNHQKHRLNLKRMQNRHLTDTNGNINGFVVFV